MSGSILTSKICLNVIKITYPSGNGLFLQFSFSICQIIGLPISDAVIAEMAVPASLVFI